MKLVVSLPGRAPQPFDFAADTSVADLLAIVAAELGVDSDAAGDVAVTCRGRVLQPSGATLASAGLADGDALEVTQALPPRVAPPPAAVTPEALRDQQPEQPVSSQMLAQGLQRFFSSPEAQANARRLELIRRIEENPFDVEAQQMLADVIRETNVQDNYEYALENNPEMLVRVPMLFVRCTVNNEPLLAMVDTGAETSIMSAAFADKCGITRLIDRRYHGLARGVGEAKIVGRVHCAPFKIGNSVLPCAFTIVEGAHLDFLLGLDILKRYTCVVDLKANCLRIGEEAVTFLSEGEIPRNPSFEAAPMEDEHKH
eukprot:m51a1_g8074 hypothetical protein (314) ;mRNA; r:185279-186448